MRPSSSKPTSHSLRYGVPLAGDAHVVVFVVDDARRAAGFVGHERGHHRGNRGLRFLAAERAAHPLADAHDLVLPDAQHLGHDGLNLGRVLRRGMDDDLPLLARIGDGRLRLQIELLLPTAGEHAAEPVRRGGQVRVHVAAGNPPQRSQELFAANRFGEIQDRLGGAAIDRHGLARFRQCGRRLGRHGRHRLTQIQNLAVGQKRLICDDQAKLVVAGHVGDGVAPDDSGEREGGACIDVQQFSGGDRAANKTNMQLAGQRAQIVNVRRWPVTWPSAESCGTGFPRDFMLHHHQVSKPLMFANER